MEYEGEAHSDTSLRWSFHRGLWTTEADGITMWWSARAWATSSKKKKEFQIPVESDDNIDDG